MTATIQLTASDYNLVMSEAIATVSDRILADALLSRQQACKMLGVSLPTLNRLPIKRAKLGSTARYRMADIKAYVDSTLES